MVIANTALVMKLNQTNLCKYLTQRPSLSGIEQLFQICLR